MVVRRKTELARAARVAAASGDSRAAIALLGRALAIEPEDLELLLELGVIAETANESAVAEIAWRRTLAAGESALKRGRLAAAQRAAKALRHMRSAARERELAARVTLERGAFDRARQLLRGDDEAWSWLLRAQVELAAGRIDRAEAAARRAVSVERSARAYALLAEVLERRGAHAEGLEAANTAFELEPETPWVRARLVRARVLAGAAESAVPLTLGADESCLFAARVLALAAAGRVAEAESVRALDATIARMPLDLDLEELAFALRRRAIWNSSPTSHATQAGSHSADLDRSLHPAIGDALDKIGEAVRAYAEARRDLDHPWMRARPDAIGLHAWAVELRGDGRQVAHLHPDAWLSGVLHVEVPSLQAPAGALEFAGPDGVLDACCAVRSRRIQPVAGTLVVFPSFLWHATVPTESPQPRLSLAFDAVRPAR